MSVGSSLREMRKTAGFSVDAITKNESAIGIEYASRFAGQFGIIHTIGATINLK